MALGALVIVPVLVKIHVFVAIPALPDALALPFGLLTVALRVLLAMSVFGTVPAFVVVPRAEKATEVVWIFVVRPSFCRRRGCRSGMLDSNT